MGFVAVSIFWFAVVFTNPDGVEDYFAPAFADQESCEHFVGHMEEWLASSGAEVQHFEPCQELTIYFKDDSV